MKREERKLVEPFFAHLPVSHAIPRANEALAMKTVELNSPILDLGCGDGEFALLTFGRRKIEVGLDVNATESKRAEKSGAYRKVVVANASVLPFTDQSFNTVIANSVLEHVENLNLVLIEIFRILQRKGILVLTVPTPLVSKYQFWSRFIPGWANFKKKVWRHRNYFNEAKWQEKLKQAGFKTIFVDKTNSQKAILWADLLFPFFWLGPIKSVASFLEKRGIFGEDKKGATLLIVAKKNGKSQR